jgi:DnaJ-domain-containing protein 1
VSIPRRLGRLAQGFVSSLQTDDRFRERLVRGRERSEALRGAFEAAWRGASEEWRRAEERRMAEEAAEHNGDWRAAATTFAPLSYPPTVLAAYNRLGLAPGASMDEVDKKRRELVKRFHPDRFSDPEKRVRAERVTAEINAAHDAIKRHVLRKR